MLIVNFLEFKIKDLVQLVELGFGNDLPTEGQIEAVELYLLLNSHLFENINNNITFTFITTKNNETCEIKFLPKIDLNFC